ncbi:hypothetical protein DFH08DRAFT_836669 [Mycena albidolilacea]|uniref:BTB domain-containing protein n=1 Tax=Mycena albidolilacea TaxID=1033008 RepID=A0AAD7ASP0_9AGAR|nr:hypothetical protein DFH08DRAFT_836669 [Mycena albidolilacea]
MSSDAEKVTRSGIWYEDGSVVLQAECKQFRVHWSVLAQESFFFHDLHQLPQKPDDPEQPCVDGCPLVELPDSVVDVEYLLKALYVPTFLGQTALPLPVIGALIRLGRKYDFRDLLDFAVARLTFENPTTLEAYDVLVSADRGYTPTRIVDAPGLLFDIITLAQENNIMSVLPCAFYRLLQSLDNLFDEVPRNDGTLVSLPFADLRRCVRARDRLLKAQFQTGYTAAWYRSWSPPDDCTTPNKCRKVRDSRVSCYLDSLHLLALSKFAPTAPGNKEFCPRCTESIELLNATGRERAWNELPGFFDLPPWDELKNNL